ncbi:hypothetical protein [Actinomyces procaprae]|uniref:phage tail tube protein n=1 Tax=Actinomyces procaprae TaxID=2560010 RepID=UPI0010A246E6|nr:hypothetical protein [Actinomyces procaprae]
MPKTLADGRIALVALTTAPANMSAPTVAELKAGTRLECRINKSDYQLGADADSTIDEQELCKRGASQDFGPSSWSGSLTPFRYLDGDGKADTDNDVAWDLLKVKGTHLWLVEREGPAYDAEFAAGQEVAVYECNTGTPQKPSDRTTGYIKRVVPVSVLDAEETAVVAA